MTLYFHKLLNHDSNPVFLIPIFCMQKSLQKATFLFGWPCIVIVYLVGTYVVYILAQQIVLAFGGDILLFDAHVWHAKEMSGADVTNELRMEMKFKYV